MEREKMEIGLPEKIEFRNHGSGIEIIRTWFGAKYVILLAFVFVWDGVLVYLAGSFLNTASRLPLFVWFMPLGHVAMGLGLTYYAIAGLFNKTQVMADYSHLAVRHGPVPWPGNKDIRAGDIKQLYSKEKVRRTKHGTTVSYSLHAMTNDEKTLKLLSGLESSEQALFIEQEIEKYLRIEDKAVRGEIPRSA